MLRSFYEILLAHRHSHVAWSGRSMQAGRERRIFSRIDLKAKSHLVHRAFGQECDAEMDNLSLSGARVAATVAWPEGSPIRLSCTEPVLDVDAMLVFRREEGTKESPRFRYGVKFQKLSWRQVMGLHRFLRTQTSDRLIV